MSPHLFFRHPRGRCDRRGAASGPNRPTQQSGEEEEASRERSYKEAKERAGVARLMCCMNSQRFPPLWI